MLLRILKVMVAAAGWLVVSLSHGAEAEEVVARCAACHALEAPDYAELGIAERLERQAPPLYFAGNKYRGEWLQQWLQAPHNIFPAGYFPNAAIRSTAEGDVPDSEALYRHEPLSGEQAETVAGYLMSLRPHDELVSSVNYSPGNLALRMGTMDFRKFKACDSCHQDAPDEGGFSGPVLHDAWQRLQPEYIASFIKDPTAWDPNTIMPLLEMNDAAVNKLVDYLRLIGAEQ